MKRTRHAAAGAEQWNLFASALPSPYKIEDMKEPTYHEWLSAVKNNPLAGGLKGFGLVFSTLGVTLLAMLFGLRIFPPGQYPRIVLVLPGLLVGGLYFYVVRFFFFKLPKVFALFIGLLIGLAAGRLFFGLLHQIFPDL
jgi:hypothetical protein